GRADALDGLLDRLEHAHALLGDGGDAPGRVAHLRDRLDDLLERALRALGRLLHAGHHRGPRFHGRDHVLDLLADLADRAGHLVGGLRAAVRELANLFGDDGEAAAVLARARRLDGRVQRQQVGLARDALDRFDEPVDLVRRPRQLGDLGGRGADRFADLQEYTQRAGQVLALLTRQAGDALAPLAHLVRALADLARAAPHLAHRAVHGTQPRRLLLRSARDADHRGGHLSARRRDLLRDAREVRCRRADLLRRR